MSRRHSAEKREIIPDAKYGDVTLTKFMNSIMYDGKKSVAEAIVYGAFENIEQRMRVEPLPVFMQALDNVAPAIEVRSRRVGGATYQVPVEVRMERRQALAIRWLITAARGRNDKTMVDRLSARTDGRCQQPRKRRQEAGRHAPDGGSQPRLLALPLVRPAVSRHSRIDLCPVVTRSKIIAISASWRTSMPGRRRRPNASSTIPASP